MRSSWHAGFAFLLPLFGVPFVSAQDHAQSRPDRDKVGAAIQAFAKDLWSKVAKREGNLTVSPGSIALALGMTAAGARGETEKQMLRVLHLDAATDLAAVGELARRLERGGKAKADARVAIVNRLFGAKECRFEAPFLQLVERSYGAPLELVPYSTAPEKAREHINAWVLEKTQKRIADLLPPGSILTDTRLTLVNAVWFLADWSRPFEADHTFDSDFTLAGGAKQKVRMMSTTANLQYAQIDGAEVVQLTYVGDEYAMLFVLPPEGAGPEAGVTAGVLGAPAALATTRVRLRLPRFKIEMTDSLRLKPVLVELGMTDAFDRGRADFTGITNPARAEDRLCVDEVYHKAFVRVDEKGTEAAAATAVVMKRAGAPPQQLKEITFDRPFVFVLRHLASGTPLFVGRVAQPGPVGS